MPWTNLKLVGQDFRFQSINWNPTKATDPAAPCLWLQVAVDASGAYDRKADVRWAKDLDVSNTSPANVWRLDG